MMGCGCGVPESSTANLRSGTVGQALSACMHIIDGNIVLSSSGGCDRFTLV